MRESSDSLAFPHHPVYRDVWDARHAARQAFDRIWMSVIADHADADHLLSRKPRMSRHRAKLRRCALRRCYRRLADQLRLSVPDCHFGKFDLETCLVVIAICDGAQYADVCRWLTNRPFIYARTGL